ncbi:hypothetical protein niasHT_011886 [Heterodera trifolii]|uniref:Uncharacterized protein n=1 Tax=Heterodera trifolii TaxID=157864 RepID=A0ABD2KW37_9BILA
MNRRKAFSRNLNPLRERRPRGRPPKGGQPTFLNAGRSPKMLPATPPTSFTLRGRRRVSSSRVLWRASDDTATITQKIDDDEEKKEIILCRRHRAHLWNLTNKSSERHPADKLVQITRELRVMFPHLRRHQRQQQRKHFCRTFGKKLSIKNCQFSILNFQKTFAPVGTPLRNGGGRRGTEGIASSSPSAPPPPPLPLLLLQQHHPRNCSLNLHRVHHHLASSTTFCVFAQSLRPSPILLHSPIINDQHR